MAYIILINKHFLTTDCTYLSKNFKALKVQKRFPNLSSTQNEIQRFSVHQLKWNLCVKHNDDMRIITLSNRGISFQFRLPVKSFFVTNSRHVSFVFQFYSQFKSQKHELAIYMCQLSYC